MVCFEDVEASCGSCKWLSTKELFALDGIDGLHCRSGSLIAVQDRAALEPEDRPTVRTQLHGVLSGTRLGLPVRVA